MFDFVYIIEGATRFFGTKQRSSYRQKQLYSC